MIFIFQTSQLSGPSPRKTIDTFINNLISLTANPEQFKKQFKWHNEGMVDEALHFTPNDNDKFSIEINTTNKPCLYWLSFGGKILCAHINATDRLVLAEGTVADFANDRKQALAITPQKITKQAAIHLLVAGAENAAPQLLFTIGIDDLLKAEQNKCLPRLFCCIFSNQIKPIAHKLLNRESLTTNELILLDNSSLGTALKRKMTVCYPKETPPRPMLALINKLGYERQDDNFVCKATINPIFQTENKY